MPYTVLDPTIAAVAPTTSLGAPKTSSGETLGSMITELVNLMMGRSDISNDASRLTKWINRGYQSICDSLDLQELNGSLALSLVLDQPFYLIPDQISFIRRLSLIDTVDYCEGGRRLIKIDAAQYRNLSELSQSPTRFFRHNRMVVIWPTPDTSYSASLDFKIRPDELVNVTDSPLIPVEFHEAIVLAARARAYRDLSMLQEQAIAENDVIRVLRPLLDTDAEESSSMTASLSPARNLRNLYRRGYRGIYRND